MKHSIKPIFFLYLLLSISYFSCAQNINSLKLLLKNAKHGSTRIKTLAELSEVCEYDEAVMYAEQCVKLAEKILPTTTNSALKKLYLKNLSGALNNIGYYAKYRGDIPKALDYYNRSLKIDEELQDKEGIAYALINIGSIYGYQGDLSKTLEYDHKSLKIMEELQNKKGIASCLNNLGVTYQYQGQNTKALEYHLRSLKLQEELQDKREIANSLNNIGGIYNAQHNSEKALAYYEKALKIREEIEDKGGTAYSLNSIGYIYTNKGEIQKALGYFKKSLTLFESIRDKRGIANSTHYIANVLQQQNKTNEALTYAKRSLQSANELGFPGDLNRAAGTLKKIYEKQNRYKQAFDMYKLQIKMLDSITNQATRKASIKKQFQYQYEKKAAADSVKNAEEQKIKDAELNFQKAQLNQEKTQRSALYGGLLLVVIFLTFVFNRFYITQKQKIIIEKQKEQVDVAYEKLHEKNKEVIDSIVYARRIQSALLPNENYIEKNLKRLIKE